MRNIFILAALLSVNTVNAQNHTYAILDTVDIRILVFNAKMSLYLASDYYNSSILYNRRAIVWAKKNNVKKATTNLSVGKYYSDSGDYYYLESKKSLLQIYERCYYWALIPRL